MSDESSSGERVDKSEKYQGAGAAVDWHIPLNPGTNPKVVEFVGAEHR